MYLDASILVPIIVEEPSSSAVQLFLDQHEGGLLVSEFAVAEVTSAVSRLVRIGEMEDNDAGQALDDLDAWRYATTEFVDITVGDLRLMTLFVRRFDTKLRAADVFHLAVC